eukprot:GDKH01006851.1.p1 GENE.GDKH01006851.1~~GDKH01006851.1.p1  ORF type:complete len:94 (+),score=6.69 GDKH01006851.1:111-392(+)
MASPLVSDCLSARHYDIVKKIGSGSYAECWLVKDTANSDKKYAAKVVDLNAMKTSNRKLAVQELRTIGSLKNPYIIGVRESFTEHDTLYIIMN